MVNYSKQCVWILDRYVHNVYNVLTALVQNVYNICSIYVHIYVQYMYNVCTSCVAIVTLWTHDLRQKWTMVTTADNKAGGPPWPHSGCLNEVCPAFRNKYLQCPVSQKGQGYHFCSKLTMISVFLQNTQLVSNCVASEFGNMGIWQYGIRTQWHKDKKRNWGEATETMHSIVDCCLCYVIDCTRKTFRIYLIYKRRVEFWQLGLMKAIWQVGCK